jgi:putative oxidoreductase
MKSLTENPLAQKLLKIAAWKIRALECFALPAAQLAARLYVGMEFWRSGTLKNAEGWDHAKETFVDLFQSEWQKNHVKHWLGMDISFPVPSAGFGAFGTTYVEIILAVLLMAGFAGRFAAAGIFVLALNIKLFVYPDDPSGENDYWMLLMAFLVASGPGVVSVDYFIRRKLLPATLPACPMSATKAPAPEAAESP